MSDFVHFSKVVDFRWGVRDIITSDHMTAELCIREIESCQKISNGPTFIVCNFNYFTLFGFTQQAWVSSLHSYKTVSLFLPSRLFLAINTAIVLFLARYRRLSLRCWLRNSPKIPRV